MTHPLTPDEATAALLEHMNQSVPAGTKHFCIVRMPESLRIKELLKVGADINARDHEGLTPLLRALSWDYASFGDFAKQEVSWIVIALITNGADMDTRTPEGKSAFDLVKDAPGKKWLYDLMTCEYWRRTLPGLKEQVGFLSPNWPQPSEDLAEDVVATFFHDHCKVGDAVISTAGFALDAIKYAIWLDPNVVNAPDENGKTALETAVDQQDWALAETLVTYGSPLNRQDEEGNTILHRLSQQDQDRELFSFAQLLVFHGADVSIKNKLDQTAQDAALENYCDKLLGAIELALDIRSDVDMLAARPAQPKQ